MPAVIRRPLPALQGLDRDHRVIYVGSFSKTLLPCIRLGYLVLPPALVETFASARTAIDRHSPTVEQAVLASFINDGSFERHIRRMRAIYMERRDVLLRSLHAETRGDVQVSECDAGLYVTGWLRHGVSEAAVVAAAAERGVDALPISSFYQRPPSRGGLVLGYGAYPPAAIRDAVNKLGDAVRHVTRQRPPRPRRGGRRPTARCPAAELIGRFRRCERGRTVVPSRSRVRGVDMENRTAPHTSLTLTSLLERAGKFFPETVVVSQRPDDSTHRSTYRDLYRRARALAAALQRLGLRRGDRVATLMWNHAWHLEAYFGIPVVGGVLHTLNLRLHADELAYIVNHAEDRFLIVDDVLLPTFEKIRDRVGFEHVIVTPFGGQPVDGDFEPYETLLQQTDAGPVYPEIDEMDPAGLCYTSGTTGRPKGVVYSHRAIALHSFAVSLPDSFSISRADTVLPAMSMFHANAWGLPFAAVMNGSRLVLPGPNLQPDRLLDLMSRHQVTLTGGVPTIWLGVLDALERDPARWPLQAGARIIVAGSAAPETLFRRFDRFGIRVIQPWGMTETTPIATVSTLKPHMDAWADDQKYERRAKQGLPCPFIEVRALNDRGEVPWDGETQGELQVRGAWVAESYYKQPEESHRWLPGGWFQTGDVVTIDADGYVKITDRTKDLIKSGGEWISSVDVENALVAHPGVAEAAVIAVPDPKWQERPLAVVVPKGGVTLVPEELREFLATRFAKWQLPDHFVFVPDLPHTSTGKLLKSALRERYKDWTPASAQTA